jgi:hypothetical protein
MQAFLRLYPSRLGEVGRGLPKGKSIALKDLLKKVVMLNASEESANQGKRLSLLHTACPFSQIPHYRSE